jgi:hypothetical protein
MSSLYSIEAQYHQLMLEIEENEGELTDELLEELKINEEELEFKVKSYISFIAHLKGEEQAIKDEKARLSNRQNVVNNLIDKLKSNLKDATVLFGEEGKSGNKVLAYDTCKLYTRKNEVVEIRDESKFILNTDTGVYATLKTKFSKPDLIKLIPFIKQLKGKEFDVDYNYSIDKTRIKSELKVGVEIPNVALVRKDNIIIK